MKMTIQLRDFLADRDGELIRDIESALASVAIERGRGERISDQVEVVRVLRAIRRVADRKYDSTEHGEMT